MNVVAQLTVGDALLIWCIVKGIDIAFGFALILIKEMWGD